MSPLFRLRNSRPGRQVTFAGLPVNVEIEVGELKTGVDDRGTEWARIYKFPYGEILKTEGADSDPVDVYLGPIEDSPAVFVVHQLRRDGEFDEDKVMLGFQDAEAAQLAYETHGPDFGFGSMDEMSLEAFREGYLASNRPEGHLKNAQPDLNIHVMGLEDEPCTKGCSQPHKKHSGLFDCPKCKCVSLWNQSFHCRCAGPSATCVECGYHFGLPKDALTNVVIGDKDHPGHGTDAELASNRHEGHLKNATQRCKFCYEINHLPLKVPHVCPACRRDDRESTASSPRCGCGHLLDQHQLHMSGMGAGSCGMCGCMQYEKQNSAEFKEGDRSEGHLKNTGRTFKEGDRIRLIGGGSDDGKRGIIESLKPGTDKRVNVHLDDGTNLYCLSEKWAALDNSSELSNPSPRPAESQADYVARFMGSAEALRDYPDPKQRAAVAYSMYEKRNSTMIEVNVGNIGNLPCKDMVEAVRLFDEYVAQSKSGSGRAAGESVAILKDGEPIKEYRGTRENRNASKACPECGHMHDNFDGKNPKCPVPGCECAKDYKVENSKIAQVENVWKCLECGRKFKDAAAAERATFSDKGCPGCGGSDIDDVPENSNTSDKFEAAWEQQFCEAREAWMRKAGVPVAPSGAPTSEHLSMLKWSALPSDAREKLKKVVPELEDSLSNALCNSCGSTGLRELGRVAGFVHSRCPVCHEDDHRLVGELKNAAPAKSSAPCPSCPHDSGRHGEFGCDAEGCACGELGERKNDAPDIKDFDRKICKCRGECNRPEPGLHHDGPCKNWNDPGHDVCVTCLKVGQRQNSKLLCDDCGTEKDVKEHECKKLGGKRAYCSECYRKLNHDIECENASPVKVEDFFRAAFGKAPTDDPSYFSDWKRRFETGNQEKFMDSRSHAIYMQLKNPGLGNSEDYKGFKIESLKPGFFSAKNPAGLTASGSDLEQVKLAIDECLEANKNSDPKCTKCGHDQMAHYDDGVLTYCFHSVQFGMKKVGTQGGTGTCGCKGDGKFNSVTNGVSVQVADQFKKEKAEHPEFKDADIWKIVRDHNAGKQDVMETIDFLEKGAMNSSSVKYCQCGHSQSSHTSNRCMAPGCACKSFRFEDRPNPTIPGEAENASDAEALQKQWEKSPLTERREWLKEIDEDGHGYAHGSWSGLPQVVKDSLIGRAGLFLSNTLDSEILAWWQGSDPEQREQFLRDAGMESGVAKQYSTRQLREIPMQVRDKMSQMKHEVGNAKKMTLKEAEQVAKEKVPQAWSSGSETWRAKCLSDYYGEADEKKAKKSFDVLPSDFKKWMLEEYLEGFDIENALSKCMGCGKVGNWIEKGADIRCPDCQGKENAVPNPKCGNDACKHLIGDHNSGPTEDGCDLCQCPEFLPSKMENSKEWYCKTCGHDISAADREPGGKCERHQTELVERENAVQLIHAGLSDTCEHCGYFGYSREDGTCPGCGQPRREKENAGPVDTAEGREAVGAAKYGSEKDNAEGQVIARWESGRGKHWVDLISSPFNGKPSYIYKSNDGGGNLGYMDSDEAAIAEMEKKVHSYLMPDAAQIIKRVK